MISLIKRLLLKKRMRKIRKELKRPRKYIY